GFCPLPTAFGLSPQAFLSFLPAYQLVGIMSRRLWLGGMAARSKKRDAIRRYMRNQRMPYDSTAKTLVGARRATDFVGHLVCNANCATRSSSRLAEICRDAVSR